MRSMTGYASVEGEDPTDVATRWRWELRSVNARGLEARFRAPSGWDGHEAGWRAALSEACPRGSVTASLTLSSEGIARAPRLNRIALEVAAEAAAEAAAALRAVGLKPEDPQPAALLGVKGVFGVEAPEEERAGGPTPSMARAVGASFAEAVAALVEARASEGRRLSTVISERIDEIERLTRAAAELAAKRQESAGERLRQKVAAVMEAATGSGAVDEARLAQELALLAVKNDVAEEIDRLLSHVAAARALIAEDAPMGRKFEFLTQEFNREANTLCSKAQDAALTEIGLALKVAIDQAREQAANVE